MPERSWISSLASFWKSRDCRITWVKPSAERLDAVTPDGYAISQHSLKAAWRRARCGGREIVKPQKLKRQIPPHGKAGLCQCDGKGHHSVAHAEGHIPARRVAVREMTVLVGEDGPEGVLLKILQHAGAKRQRPATAVVIRCRTVPRSNTARSVPGVSRFHRSPCPTAAATSRAVAATRAHRSR